MDSVSSCEADSRAPLRVGRLPAPPPHALPGHLRLNRARATERGTRYRSTGVDCGSQGTPPVGIDMMVAPAKLPFAPCPYSAELLSSWLLRVAAANLVSLRELLDGFESRYGQVLNNFP